MAKYCRISQNTNGNTNGRTRRRGCRGGQRNRYRRHATPTNLRYNGRFIGRNDARLVILARRAARTEYVRECAALGGLDSLRANLAHSCRFTDTTLAEIAALRVLMGKFRH